MNQNLRPVEWLDDECHDWPEFEEDLRDICDPECHSEPTVMAESLREKAKEDPEYCHRVVFIIDLLINFADVVEDWEGNEQGVKNDPGVAGLVFLEQFLFHENSPYRSSTACVLTQRRLDQGNVKTLVNRIDIISGREGNTATPVFSKMTDQSEEDFFVWLETNVNK